MSTRALVDDDIQWLDIAKLDPAKKSTGTTTPGGSEQGGGGEDEGEEGTYG